MTAVYMKIKNSLERFIFGYKNNIQDLDDVYQFKDIESISSGAFDPVYDFKQIYFDAKLQRIEKEAFKNCENLEVFCCGKTDTNGNFGIENISIHDLKLSKSVTQPDKGKTSAATTFTTETRAFSGCEKLHTVILPNCDKLIIEKNAFEDCCGLRTFICSSDSISFTENPFEGCSEDLVFIGLKDSGLERFARENGYGFINVQ